MKIALLLFVFIITSSQIAHCQNNPDTFVRDTTVPWIHLKQYHRIMRYYSFDKGMSDDAISAILMRKGKNYNKLSLAFLITGLGSITTAGILMGSGNIETLPAFINLIGVSLTFAILSISFVINGSIKTSQAGVVLQHKWVTVRTSVTGISLNF